MSDIFDEYAKIAIAQGLVSEAQDVGDETNPRFDSLSNDDIKALYGIKPNGEDEKHILDQAHPESVVIAPSYDKMNGLVENLFERQDIMAWIATKPNDGKHTNERYVKASQELTMALLNTAFMLDKTGDTELMKLADDCADRLNKTAIAPLLIAGLGVAALTTIALVNNFGGEIDRGVQKNAEAAINRLNDVLSSGDLVGQEEYVTELIDKIVSIKELNEDLSNVFIDPKSPNVEAEVQASKDKLKQYAGSVREIGGMINSIMDVIRGRGSSEKSWFDQYTKPGNFFSDLAEGIGKVWSVFSGDDMTKAVDALGTLKSSLDESIPQMIALVSSVRHAVRTQDSSEIDRVLNSKSDERPTVEQAGSAYKQEESEEPKEVVDLNKYIPTSGLETPREKAQHGEVPGR